MDEKKLERLVDNWLGGSSNSGSYAHSRRTLINLVKRVYRMGQKDGYWLGHNGHPISTNKKRGER